MQADSQSCVVAVATVPLLFAGCDKLAPAGQNSTMTLLRNGSEKVCIASDVQKAMRDLVVPKPAEVWPDTELQTRVTAAAGVSLSYALTTLQSFDKAVAKATCNSTVTIRGATDDKTNKFRIDYEITPSAENPNMFVVTANFDDARAFAKQLMGDAIDAVADDAAAEDAERQEAQKRQELLAVIGDKWLLGAWIDSGDPASSCGNGQAIWFEAAHVLEGGLGKSRWSLAQDQLHLVGGGDKPFDTTVTITAADPISFAMTFPNGNTTALRRCTRDETEALPPATEQGSAPQ